MDDNTRHAWPYRLVEAVGLVTLIYGLAASAWATALAGAALTAATYALYRRRHGQAPGGDPASMGMGDGD